MANYSQATINSSHRRLGLLLQLFLDGKPIHTPDMLKKLVAKLARDPSEFITDMFFTDLTAFNLNGGDIIQLVITWKLGIKRQEYVTKINYNTKTTFTEEQQEIINVTGTSVDDEDAPDHIEDDDDPEFDLINAR